MVFVWDDLISASRVYVDDDTGDDDGWLSPEQWLRLGNVEYANLRKRWVRMGLISPAAVDTPFVNATVLVSGVLCTIGVAQDLGNGRLRVLRGAQAPYGRAPFWSTTNPTNWASWWEAHGEADNLTYTIQPADTSTGYFVRTIPTVAYATDVSQTVDLPYGGDERLILGMAKRAHVKDSTRSAAIQELIKEADEEMNFTAFGRGGESPRGKSTPRTSTAAISFNTSFPSNPSFWRY